MNLFYLYWPIVPPIILKNTFSHQDRFKKSNLNSIILSNSKKVKVYHFDLKKFRCNFKKYLLFFRDLFLLKSPRVDNFVIATIKKYSLMIFIVEKIVNTSYIT